jgi:hypothetical protein
VSSSDGGNCFEQAALHIVAHPKAMLVHAQVWGEGVGWHDHAWCEESLGFFGVEIVVDQSNGLNIRMPKDAYYNLGRVSSVRRYTFEQALEQMNRTGHYGPW